MLVLVLVDDEVEVDVEVDDEVLRWYTEKRREREGSKRGMEPRKSTLLSVQMGGFERLLHGLWRLPMSSLTQ